MKKLLHHVLASTGALLLLETIQIVIESIAAAFVYRGQVLPAYGFFPTQIYDFLAKMRWAADRYLSWLPPLPDRFRPPSMLGHVTVGLDLLPAGIAMALLLGVIAGTAGSLIPRRREVTLRSYLWVWLLVGLAVHVAAAIPPLLLEENPSLHHILYRSRSFIIDGTAVGLAVFAASCAAAFTAAPALARSRQAARLLATTAVAIAIVSSLATPAGRAEPKEDPSSAVPAASATRMNVLLISLDSLRADHVGCYGYERDTTPAIDKLASEGVRFANAVSTSSWTLPTHLTMFTSRYQLSHGVTQETFVLSPSVPTLGEQMKAGGYVTAGFVSAPYLAAHYGYARGMDSYQDLSAEYGHRDEARSAVVSGKLADLVLPWLEKHRNDPFFLFVHDFDIHYDYVPPAPYDTMFDPDYRGTVDGTNFIARSDVNKKMNPRDLAHIVALYDGEIRFTDDHVAKILDKVDALGLRERTIVVLVADHGDEFFEHGNKGHHRTVYDEVLRVPMVMRLPGMAKPGTVVDEQVSLVDLMPTILSAAGIPSPTGIEGISLLPLLQGRASGRSAIYAEFFDKRGFNLQVARRTQGGKVIQHFNRITHPHSEPIELYDLTGDTREQHNLAKGSGRAKARGDLTQMAQWLNDRWAVHRRLQLDSGTRIDIDADTMQRLKSLGYVQE